MTVIGMTIQLYKPWTKLIFEKNYYTDKYFPQKSLNLKCKGLLSSWKNTGIKKTFHAQMKALKHQKLEITKANMNINFT